MAGRPDHDAKRQAGQKCSLPVELRKEEVLVGLRLSRGPVRPLVAVVGRQLLIR